MKQDKFLRITMGIMGIILVTMAIGFPMMITNDINKYYASPEYKLEQEIKLLKLKKEKKESIK